jgi:diaminopimelate epimerase
LREWTGSSVSDSGNGVRKVARQVLAAHKTRTETFTMESLILAQDER